VSEEAGVDALGDDVVVSGETRPSAAELAKRLSTSERLRQRRYELLPTTGPGAPFTEVQGRGPGESVAPANLIELISSISSIGVLQPVLVEQLPDQSVRVVAGERRLRAVRWGAVHHPDNPHFKTVPAIVCPGPLSEQERRIWQLVENLSREDLQPGELAAALLFERSAVLTTKLLVAEVPVPPEVAYLEDPVARWRALDRLRVNAGCHHVGAPWEEVLRRLGIQLRPEKAKALVRAFAAIPAEISAEMDAAKVALLTRMEYLRLGRGRADAAAELWEAVKATERPELLGAAVRERLDHPTLDAEGALEAAQALHDAADEARARAQRERVGTATSDGPQPVPEDVAREAARALKELLAALRAGAALDPYLAGSFALFATELGELVGEAAARSEVAAKAAAA